MLGIDLPLFLFLETLTRLESCIVSQESPKSAAVTTVYATKCKNKQSIINTFLNPDFKFQCYKYLNISNVKRNLRFDRTEF
jgi:hypothetical protein